MAITNRDLPEGTRLAANYKKQTYVCTVERDEEGKPAFVLEDGRRFKSPSAAGSAIMDGIACNGWRFFIRINGTVEPAAEKPRAKKANGKNGKLISRTPNQKGVPEGQRRWFCNGCMASFLAESTDEPEACPQGHRTDDPELTAPAGEGAR